jgi:DNA-binding transcriptional regulator YiaG
MTPSEAKRIRKDNGLSQTEMAHVLRIGDIRTIRRWETGERPVSGPASILYELFDKRAWRPLGEPQQKIRAAKREKGDD